MSDKEIITDAKPIEPIKAKKEEEVWPPYIGVWSKTTRANALRRLPLRPDEELIEGVISFGFTINGIHLKGKQMLPKSMWKSIRATLSRRQETEESFIRGGKDKVNILGTFSG